MYRPPPTDALLMNPVTGQLSPITSSQALILFSSPEDDARILPLLKELDANMKTEDGAGIVCPPVAYGNDGRKITLCSGVINGLPWQECVGILIAQQFYGSMWNEGRQPPYTKLFADQIGFSDPNGQGSELEINWGH